MRVGSDDRVDDHNTLSLAAPWQFRSNKDNPTDSRRDNRGEGERRLTLDVTNNEKLTFGTDDGGNRRSRSVDNQRDLRKRVKPRHKTLHSSLTTGLRSETKFLFPFSSSFLESALRWNVVCFVLWFVDASILTLNLFMTCFMISPRVIGLPSLPAEERSIAVSVKDSVA